MLGSEHAAASQLTAPALNAWRGSGLTPESTHNAYPTRAAGRGRSRQSCVSASGSAADARFFFFFFFFFSEPSSDLARLPSKPPLVWTGMRFATSCLSGSRHRSGVLPSLPTTTV